MTDSYSLTVINDSEIEKPTFAVFATLPVSSDYDTLGLAWLIQQIDENNQYVFTWDIDWGFAWTASGTSPGYQWTGSGKLSADPNSATGCRAEFGYNGDFQLNPGVGTPTGYTLWITDDPTVPLPKKEPSSVAVTLHGLPVCATNAGPNLFQTFTLHPTYYISAGDYVQGQMVDGTSVTSFYELEYSAGTTALTATLSEDNTWSSASSKELDFAAMFSERADGVSDDVGGKKTGICYSDGSCEGKVFSRSATMKGCRKLKGKSWKGSDGQCRRV